ncbi:MAG: hypothetical protein JXX14_15990, partial [Deltaproteobacteria bacterium]|nr:hypothetical protein [Deltaproteobacteria bacterium]
PASAGMTDFAFHVAKTAFCDSLVGGNPVNVWTGLLCSVELELDPLQRTAFGLLRKGESGVNYFLTHLSPFGVNRLRQHRPAIQQ